jgi:hypothetical protein
MRYLKTLRPGTRFRLHEMPEVTGVLIKVNECRAVVRLDRPDRDVEFQDANGETRQFRSRGSQVTSWAPATPVEPVGFQSLNEENEMSKSTTKKTKAAKQPKSTKAGRASAAAALAATINAPLTKPAKPAKAAAPKEKKPAAADGKLSAIDAAAKVLGEAKEPLHTTSIIDAMAKKGYWTSPGGKTPAATLYSAILREIQVKGKESRFKKTERGMFTLA